MAGAWSRGGTSMSGPPGDVTGVKLDPRVETSVEAYTTLNELLTDYIEHVSQHCHFTSDCPRRRRQSPCGGAGDGRGTGTATVAAVPVLALPPSLLLVVVVTSSLPLQL